MLALVPKYTEVLSRLILLALLAFFAAACATKDPPHLVSDPENRPESTLPWNKQEKWEIGGGIPGQLGESR